MQKYCVFSSQGVRFYAVASSIGYVVVDMVVNLFVVHVGQIIKIAY